MAEDSGNKSDNPDQEDPRSQSGQREEEERAEREQAEEAARRARQQQQQQEADEEGARRKRKLQDEYNELNKKKAELEEEAQKEGIVVGEEGPDILEQSIGFKGMHGGLERKRGVYYKDGAIYWDGELTKDKVREICKKALQVGWTGELYFLAANGRDEHKDAGAKFTKLFSEIYDDKYDASGRVLRDHGIQYGAASGKCPYELRPRSKQTPTISEKAKDRAEKREEKRGNRSTKRKIHKGLAGEMGKVARRTAYRKNLDAIRRRREDLEKEGAQPSGAAPGTGP